MAGSLVATRAPADEKLKKAEGVPELVLEPTTDILVALAERKRPGQVLVGFAAETERVREQARSKLREKGLDLLVANDVSAPGAGFEHDTNRVVLLDAAGNQHDVPLTDKREVARIVFDAVVAHRKGQGQTHS